MNENAVSISQRENYHPSRFTIFLWWLSTAEKELLEDAVVDRNRYKIIGMTVLATWIFATLAWTYFFSTVMSNDFLAILPGLFMGFIILTIDRALIKGINKYNRNKVLPLLFRSVLALTIGTFMAQPAILYMFDKEIRLQASLDNDQKRKTKLAELASYYKPRNQEITSALQAYLQQLTTKYQKVEEARKAFLAETDGTGGTGKIGDKGSCGS